MHLIPGELLQLTEDLDAEFSLLRGDVVEYISRSITDPKCIKIRTAFGKYHTFYESRFVKAPAATTSRKDDAGKLDMTLLDTMPNALRAVVEVMQWAVTKKLPVPYERGSWQGVHADRYRAAIKRHDRDACDQYVSSAPIESNRTPPRFQCDKETELLHLAHIATSALMALENTIRELKEKK